MKLDIGAGPRALEGFLGVDREPECSTFWFDVTTGDAWPWLSDSVSHLHARHFIEHIPKEDVQERSNCDRAELYRMVRALRKQAHPAFDVRYDPDQPRPRRLDKLVFFFNEAFRVAEPGAPFDLAWPVWDSVFAEQDPTHRRNIPLDLLRYLSKRGRTRLGVDYYLGASSDWEIEEGSVRVGVLGGVPFEHRATLRAVKEPWGLYQREERSGLLYLCGPSGETVEIAP